MASVVLLNEIAQESLSDQKKRSGRIGNLRVILPTDVKFDQATKIKLCVAREEIALQTNLVQFV